MQPSAKDLEAQMKLACIVHDGFLLMMVPGTDTARGRLRLGRGKAV